MLKQVSIGCVGVLKQVSSGCVGVLKQVLDGVGRTKVTRRFISTCNERADATQNPLSSESIQRYGREWTVHEKNPRSSKDLPRYGRKWTFWVIRVITNPRSLNTRSGRTYCMSKGTTFTL